MKKIINRPETVVLEMCNGIVLAHSQLTLDPRYKIIRKRVIDADKVSLISGGGSGHEPAHAGFVGEGMLDAAVCGDVFASPSQVQVYHAIKETASKKGTLLIVKNYSGDVMNFRNAADMAEGDVTVETVIVNDDIAVQDSLYTVGRRGVAGTVLVHKIAGAAAALGWDLQAVKTAAQLAIRNIRSVGFALTSCTVPAKGTPTFQIGEEEMEYGVGIHGEPGIAREKTLGADALAERMVGALVCDLGLNAGEEVTILVNGFGATPLQELYLLNNAVCRELSAKKILVYREFVGNYMTSIDMAGASITIMKMDQTLKQLLDERCDAPSFHVYGAVRQAQYVELPVRNTSADFDDFGMRTDASFAKISGGRLTYENMLSLVDRMGTFIIEQEIPFCELDSHAGDGDFGMSVAKGFKQLKREWPCVLQKNGDIGLFLTACSLVIMEHCGGASGPIWGSAFLAAGKYAKGKESLSVENVSLMLSEALAGIQRTGERSFGRGAVVGDKTLVDALSPCVDAWKQSAMAQNTMKEAFEAGARAAVHGAKSTEGIVARMGRAGTVGERSLGYPDAGAYAVGEIFEDLARHVL